jgi:predicted lipoprotein with Yx(FWY)xxD motif
MPSRLIRRRRSAATVIAAVAAASMLAVAAVAIAKTFTLNVAKNATVTNATTMATKHENIAVNGRGFAVYWLSGDSKSHAKCTQTNGCFKFWPPVTAASAKALSKAAAISGKLTSWKRDGFTQAVLGGHPIYTFAPDTKKHDATGDGVVAFGGTWHVVTASGGQSPSQAGQSNPNPNPYPPGY